MRTLDPASRVWILACLLAVELASDSETPAPPCLSDGIDCVANLLDSKAVSLLVLPVDDRDRDDVSVLSDVSGHEDHQPLPAMSNLCQR